MHAGVFNAVNKAAGQLYQLRVDLPTLATTYDSNFLLDTAARSAHASLLDTKCGKQLLL